MEDRRSAETSWWRMPGAGNERLKALPPYLFAEIDRHKRAAKAAHRDIIDFGVGDPDLPTPAFIRERMARAIHDPANHRYPLGGGSPAFRQQIARFFSRRYGVELDPQREIVALIGSKEGLAHLPLAVINPGDVVLVPSPGYPVYHASTIFAGGVPHVFDLGEYSKWLPRLETLPGQVLAAARLLFLNYPNNPTGATAHLAFFCEAVNFARFHNLVIAQDAAYNELYLGAQRPPSILEVPGARDVAIEFHSASKTFNMTGWRVGFAVGNADLIAALTEVKANFDSGVFGAIQEAAGEAYDQFDHPDIQALRSTYRERGELLCGGLRAIGFQAHPPEATFYVWARVPAGQSSMSVCGRLLDEARVVCVPGVGFGRTGEGYVRFALTVSIDEIHQALERMGAVRW